jgi:hypothetical protein
MSKRGARRVGETATARVYQLGNEPLDDLTSTTTAAERIELGARLSRRAWELTGKPWPTLPRAEWPLTIVRPR